MTTEKTKISAEIVADSVDAYGNRLTSLLVTFPRIILSEVNTHRMLSKNTSSSRAIPFKKMVESVENDPFIPIAFQKSHSGMQGTEYLTGLDYDQAEFEWLEAKDRAIEQAQQLDEIGTTKQLCNRLLEPFMWTTMLITGSRSSWNNFFELRCPAYELGMGKENIYFRSKKEYQEYLKLNGFTYTVPEENWKFLNKGQAEIHIMDLSEKIYDEYQNSVPSQLKENHWHIPFRDKINELYPDLTLEEQIKVSVGMAANTSYTVVGDGSIITLEKATRIHDKCKELSHSSVFEHCARVMSDEEYYSFSKGQDGQADHQHGWCRNLKGFISYRHIIETKS